MTVKDAVQEEPVFAALNGLGVVTTSTLILLTLIGVTDLQPDEIAKLGGSVQVFVNAVAAVIRPFVTPNVKVETVKPEYS